MAAAAFPAAEVAALVDGGMAFSNFDGEEWPVHAEKWHCRCSERKSCCRCLKRARGHSRRAVASVPVAGLLRLAALWLHQD